MTDNTDAELREQIALWLTKWTGDITFKEHGSIDELMVHIKARDAAIREDELNSLITRVPDGTYVLNLKARSGILDRIAELRRESDLVGRKNNRGDSHE